MFPCREGIWDFLPAGRAAAFATFLRDYQTVRAAEGWGSDDAAYYRSLPEVEARDPRRAIWLQRAASYRVLRDRVVAPLAARHGRPLSVLDLGAGNCWLAHRLTELGHRVAAIDLSTSATDGLGAHARYGGAPFDVIRAEFDRLPLAPGQADLVVFNASLHYSRDVAATLREALRVLHPAGQIVVLDSPVYRDASSGALMIQQRDERFRRELGIAGGEIQLEGFLSWGRLGDLARDLDLAWHANWPMPAWRRAARRAKAWLGGRREPAEFPVLVGPHPPPLSTRVERGDARRSGRSLPPLQRRWRGAGGEAPFGPRLVSSIRTSVGRALVRWRFRLFQRRRFRRLVLEQVGPWPILVLPDVFNPRLFRTGEFLALALGADLIGDGATVLDLGTGTGVGAIAASHWASRVIAVDVNPEAVRCARINAALNHLDDRIDVREGDLFGPVAGERFDVVLFNPPFFRGEPRDLFDLAWRSPDVVERFAAALPEHLTPAGHALVVLSSDGDTSAFLRTFQQSGLAIDAVARRRFLNETLTVYRLRVAGVASPPAPLHSRGEGSERAPTASPPLHGSGEGRGVRPR